MSFEYYTKWWIKSQKNLEYFNEKDALVKNKFKPITDRNLANALIGGMYTKYSMLVQDLCACVDQMAQPQKRISVKKLVDSACIRLNEFNDELRKISLSEYHYVDGSLVELKLIPYDVEILHPCLFHHRPIDVEELIRRIKSGETIYVPPVATTVYSEQDLTQGSKSKLQSKSIIKGSQMNVEAKPEGTEGNQAAETEVKDAKKSRLRFTSVPIIKTPEEEKREHEMMVKSALRLIQTAERARQERIYYCERNIKFQRSKALRAEGPRKEPQPPDPVVTNQAAKRIQKIWRGVRDRDKLRFREDQRRLLIGMTEPSWRSTNEFEVFEANLEKRRRYRDEKIKAYIEAIDKEKARILRVVAPGLLEDIEDEIREWFHEWYVGARTFDNYLPEEKGGTILVVRGETMTPKEYLDDYEKKRRAKVKAGGKDALKEKQAKEKKQKEEAEKKKKEDEKKRKEAEAKKKKSKKKPGDFEIDEYGVTTSTALRAAGEEDFEKLWNERSDFDNPEAEPYIDIITEKWCYETQLEVRKQADELMRLELDLLQEALARDKGKKYKPKKQKKKKGKKKGKKDLTADRLTEDLFQELVDNGVIRPYPKVTLDQFTGDFSYKNTELRMHDFDPPATMLDVRQAVTMNCIQPLGVETMKKPRSVLIAGAGQTGKHLLANAVFYHTQCVLFDLSPEVTAQIYPGKKGLAMLIHLITKMSKILQPSIIFFDRAERIFYKKVPKDEKDLDPKRVGNKLAKGIIKLIKPEDRILVLGVTAAPWLAQAAKMKKAFERVILIPRPDYGSVYMWWREFLRPYHGISRDFNFTSLTTTTINQPYSVIKGVVEDTLTTSRIIQLKYRPLQQQELYEQFVSKQIEPISDKEWKKFIKWYNKTPLGKERAVLNKWADAKRELEAKQQEKQKGKK